MQINNAPPIRKRCCDCDWNCPGLTRYWERCCAICICFYCGIKPIRAVKCIAVFSVVVGIFSTFLGLWLAGLTLLNTTLPESNQIFFEKIRAPGPGPGPKEDFFNNESPVVLTALHNLNFYLMSMATIAFLGGIGRIISSFFLFYHVRKNSTSSLMSWAWVILSMLAVCSLVILSLDTLNTLSHKDLAPPHSTDFYFTNDRFGFYILCYTYKYTTIVDLVLTTYFQWVVRWYFRTRLDRSYVI